MQFGSSNSTSEEESADINPEAYIEAYMSKNQLRIPLIKTTELVFDTEINKGSSCKVFKGRWRGTDVGIKQFNNGYRTNKSEREAFIRELRILCQIRHPNLLLVMGVALDSPNFCIITEYIEN
jgi:hypothetical protein